MSTRHLARTIVLQTLFEWDFNQQTGDVQAMLNEQKKEFGGSDFDDHSFSNELLAQIINKLPEIDSLITQYAPEWPIDQITYVDRNVLRLGIYELKFNTEIPPKVAINEAIELAKAYGGDSSGKFINGVLGTIYKEMETKGEKKDLPQESNKQLSAGGVVFRKTAAGYLFALILDAYGKWTFPKGKIEVQEDKEVAAMREVTEEIGLTNLTPLEYLGSIDIKINDPQQKPKAKTVFYYLMSTDQTDFTLNSANKDASEARWLTPQEALAAITYANALSIFHQALIKLHLPYE
ncbi:MAG: transcription antitermination factor NusB [Candidatus Komeilibacteria bacterium]|nr:transcription antitermination factor NusB [Candidatus Komeilibacteria bacterium]